MIKSHHIAFNLFFLILSFAFVYTYSSPFLLVDFKKSMNRSTDFEARYASHDQKWLLLESIYRKNMRKQVSLDLKIPKIIHWVWLGSPLPQKYIDLQKKWRKVHSDWECKVWLDDDVNKLALINRDAFNACDNWGAKSDIVRYEILYRYGGLYVDTDFECVKSFEKLHHACNFYAGIGYEKKVIILNGLIGAVPYHPIIKNCIDMIQSQRIVAQTQPKAPHAIMNNTGPYLLTRAIFNNAYVLNDQILLLPITYLYPFPAELRENEYSYKNIKKWLAAESLAVHLWHCSWMK